MTHFTWLTRNFATAALFLAPVAMAQSTLDGTPANGDVINAAGQVVSSAKQCGVFRNLAYSIVDQQNPAQVIQGLKNVQVSEIFSDFSGTGTTPTPPPPQPVDLDNCPGGIGSTQCAADLIDTIYIGHIAPACLAPNENQSFKQAFSVKIGKTDNTPGKDFSLTTTNMVSRGNFNGTLKVDVSISNQ